MKSYRIAFVLITSILVLGGCETQPVTPSPTPAPDWKTFDSKDGGFSILLPGTPYQKVDSLRVGDTVVENHVFAGDYKPIAYSLTYIDVPTASLPLDADQLLAQVRDVLINDQPQNVISDQQVSLANCPGREITFKNPLDQTVAGDNLTTVRLYLVNQRVYQIRAVVPIYATQSPDIEKFLSSFKLIENDPCRQTVQANATVAATSDWQPFTSAAGNFSALMPGLPAETVKSIDIAAARIDASMFASTNADMSFTVGYGDFLTETLKQLDSSHLLDSSAAGVVQSINGKLISSQKITFGKYPGRDLTLDTKLGLMNATARARLYLVKSRLYILIDVTIKDNAQSADTDKFFNSFQLLNK